jgi:hypothetical protein
MPLVSRSRLIALSNANYSQQAARDLAALEILQSAAASIVAGIFEVTVSTARGSRLRPLRPASAQVDRVLADVDLSSRPGNVDRRVGHD